MVDVNAGSVRGLTDRHIRSGADRAGPWADLGVRLLSSLVLIPLALFCVWRGGAVWAALLATTAMLLVLEWAAMVRTGGLGWPWLAGGLVYLVVALASLAWLRADPRFGRSDVLVLLLFVWASDVGAYAAGRAIGGRRMAPSVSPGKTWSGAAGGLLAAMAIGLVLGWHAHPLAGMLAGAALSAAAQLGDLGESAAKRRCGVKDSGRLIPGHGGLLDRVDGVLLAAPVLAAWGLVVGRGLLLWN